MSVIKYKDPVSGTWIPVGTAGSGSMTDEQKAIVRTAAFWLDTWLQSQYDGVETRYIIHDAAAKEVDEGGFLLL